jgi:DNA-binding transcriptional LysR family regulator
MEMHQVRYFLAVSRTLNFTRAAEECNVTQPSLTRAIKQLEGELGGDLFRRERPAAMLTELGQRMYPLLKQCYDAAIGARSLATSFRKGDVGALRMALSHTIDLSLLIPFFEELKRSFSMLEFKFLRGSSKDVVELLKKGEVELGLAAGVQDDWDRLDRWPLFMESFRLVVNEENPLASLSQVGFEELAREKILLRRYCESNEQLSELLRGRGIDVSHSHEVGSERDLVKLLEADIGVAIMPDTALLPERLVRRSIDGFGVGRTVMLYGVAGRERTAIANAIMKLLRGADWQRHLAQLAIDEEPQAA